MSALSIILYAILAWFLYNLVFKFIIPIYRASKKMKQQFRQMQEKMQEQQARFRQQANAGQQQPAPEPKPKPSGDYIDFEEIK